MTVYSYTSRVFTPFEILFWSLFLGIPTALSVGAIFTKQDPPIPVVAWVILGLAVAGMWAGAGIFLYRKWSWQKLIRFLLVPPGLAVGWAEDQYCVSSEAVQEELRGLVAKMSPEYPRAADALQGCVVFFREPAWLLHQPGSYLTRKVAGVQDGQLITVGWHEDLSKSALGHELAHRILQVYGGDPPEVIAHHLMARLGVL